VRRPLREEEVLAQREALDDGQARSHAERQRYQALFQLAPAPYLVTDPLVVIRDANQRAAGLLGVGGRFVAGKPLASFVAGDDRPRLRDLLSRLPRTDTAEWRVRLAPRGRDQIQVLASVAVGRDGAGVVRELRWLLWPLPQVAVASPPAPAGWPAGARRPGRGAARGGVRGRAAAAGRRGRGEGPCVDAFASGEPVPSPTSRGPGPTTPGPSPPWPP
jgi:PAS domain S-box-containing protein